MPAPQTIRAYNGQDYVRLGGLWVPCTLVEAHATGAVGAGVTASIPAAVAELGYVYAFGLEWAADGVGTVNTQLNLINTLTTPWSFKFTTVAGAAGYFPVTELPHPMAGSAVNTAVQVNAPAVANRASVSIHIWGYRIPSPS